MIEFRGIQKSYRMGENVVHALRGVSLRIERGEFVAIMGPSGSGKSTLMHIMGLLDVPETGSYRLLGKEMADLPANGLAILRRETIGFIFQQFNLLPRMSAVENVSMPLFYAGRMDERERSRTLLEKIGLGARLSHKPNELSGGQQQRVAIARSLINRPNLILADEPTGNLDSKSQQEIMETLKELNRQGITIVIVTHEEEIGAQARRLIRMRDGVIQSDEPTGAVSVTDCRDFSKPESRTAAKERTVLVQIHAHLEQGFRTLGANKIRTSLSMLGILIGVAAVVAMLALGRGAKQAVEAQISSLGSNLLVLKSGSAKSGGASLGAGSWGRLVPDDAAAITKIPGVRATAPNLGLPNVIVSYQNKNWNTQIIGTTPSYARMHSAVPDVGRFFVEQENRIRSAVAVVGPTIVRKLFGERSPINEAIKINRVNFKVIGVLPPKGAIGSRDPDDQIVVPLSTGMHRISSWTFIDSIDIEVDDPRNTSSVQDEAIKEMSKRHKVPLSIGS